MQTNRDQLPDDIVAVFARQSCNFGFVSHLFTPEIKMAGGEPKFMLSCCLDKVQS